MKNRRQGWKEGRREKEKKRREERENRSKNAAQYSIVQYSTV